MVHQTESLIEYVSLLHDYITTNYHFLCGLSLEMYINPNMFHIKYQPINHYISRNVKKNKHSYHTICSV